jgi:hypothetical protein
MQTRQGAPGGAATSVEDAPRATGSMVHAVRFAGAAIAGCVALIAVGAAMSMLWAVNPLLMVGVVALVVVLGARLAGFAFRAGNRT